MYLFIYIYICIYLYVFIYRYVFIFIYIYIYLCIYIYLFIYVCNDTAGRGRKYCKFNMTWCSSRVPQETFGNVSALCTILSTERWLEASLSCCFPGLPYRLRLPVPGAAGTDADAEGGGGARNRHGFPPVWWRWSPPGSEAAAVCSAPAAGEDSMAQHSQHLPKSQPGASKPGTPANHCEAPGGIAFYSLNQLHHRRTSWIAQKLDPWSQQQSRYTHYLQYVCR